MSTIFTELLHTTEFSSTTVFSYTPENWATTEFSSTVFTELLHTAEFSSTTMFLYTPENLYTIEFTSTTEFMSTEYFFQIYVKLCLVIPVPQIISWIYLENMKATRRFCQTFGTFSDNLNFNLLILCSYIDILLISKKKLYLTLSSLFLTATQIFTRKKFFFLEQILTIRIKRFCDP